MAMAEPMQNGNPISDLNKIKQEIIAYPRKHSEINFMMIEHIFKLNEFDYKGNLYYGCGNGCPKVVFWGGWNEQAINLVSSLHNIGLLMMFDKKDRFAYDGSDNPVTDLPIGESGLTEYEEIRWVPVAFWDGFLPSETADDIKRAFKHSMKRSLVTIVDKGKQYNVSVPKSF